jgi:hypothetical protein
MRPERRQGRLKDARLERLRVVPLWGVSGHQLMGRLEPAAEAFRNASCDASPPDRFAD